MPQQRDLNRTREQIMAAAQKEFAEHGFAGARTDAIARRARVNERMIFYCFDSKEGLYRAVLKQKMAEKAALIEPDEDFTTGLIKGFSTICNDLDSMRMWQWEALDKSSRKLVAEEERRAFFQAEVARLRRAKANGTLPVDADVEMLFLVSIALRAFPLLLPQAVSLVTGMDPLDPEFQGKWTACLESVGRRLIAPVSKNGDEFERKAADKSAGPKKEPIKTRRLHHTTGMKQVGN